MSKPQQPIARGTIDGFRVEVFANPQPTTDARARLGFDSHLGCILTRLTSADVTTSLTPKPTPDRVSNRKET